jgi:fibronectin type 3 domain-containing protein
MKKIFVLILIAVSFSAYSQQLQKEVKVIARAFPDSIVLRWAPTDPISWQLGNQYGYHIVRHTILRDGKVLNQQEKKQLTNTPILPKRLEEWEVLKGDKNAMVAAQALYGESFEIEGTGSYNLMQVYQKSREDVLRHSFALSAADFSARVADYAGLRFVDKGVQRNEKYLYRLSVALPPSENVAINSGSVFVGLEEYKPLPLPLDLHAEFSDRQVMLSWNFDLQSDHYIGFWLERSTDGVSFQRLNTNPIVITYPENGQLPESYYRLDSLPANGQTYHYRVRGISPFGEVGPPSAVVTGKGIGKVKNAPFIHRKEALNNEEVLLGWKYPFADSLNIVHYEVQRAIKERGPYQPIARNLPSSQQSFTDKRPLLTNYYKVSAFDAAGSAMASMPVLLQLVDSLPPQPPAGLTGKMDTTGLVLIQWEASLDKDVLGYRIYRGNSPEEEFSQVTRSPISSLELIDTLSTRNLNTKVYYKVMAIDLRQNHSVLSELLTIEKPDVSPPVSPVFKTFAATEEGIALTWHNSSSPDVSNHLLYRTPAGQNKWVLLAAFSQGEGVEAYIDKATEPGKEYQYTLLAIDHSKLESKPAAPVKVVRIDKGVRPAIEHVYGELDKKDKNVVLRWEYPYEGVEKYLVYKAKEGEKLALLASVDAGEKKTFVDTVSSTSTGYTYKIVAHYQGGAMAGSKLVSIQN